MTGMQIIANVTAAENLLRDLGKNLSELPCKAEDTKVQWELVDALRNAYVTVRSVAIEVTNFAPQIAGLTHSLEAENCKRD